jgi:PAS domain S-box-containing protein
LGRIRYLSFFFQLENSWDLCYKSFFDLTPNLLCIADDKGSFLKLNREWENVLGYGVKELENRRFFSFIHPDDIKKTVIVMDKMVRSKVAGFTNRYRCKDGSYKTIEWHASLVGDLIYAAARDVTNETIIEQMIDEGEQRLAVLNHLTFGGVIIHDRREIVECNNHVCNVLGYSRDEIIGSNILKLVAPECIDIVKSKIVEKDQKGYQIFCIKSNGERIPVRIEGREIRYKGESVRLVEVRDLSEQFRDSYKTIRNEVKYRELINNIKSGVAVYKPIDGGKDFIFTEYNLAAEKIVGIARKDIIGKSILEIRPDAEKRGLLSIFRDVMINSKVISLDPQLYEGDGKQLWVENFIYLIPTGEVVSVFDDVTKQTEYEHSLIESEMKYRELFNNMHEGWAFHEIVTDDDGRPIDYIFLDINIAFENITGFKRGDIVGRRVKEILPNTEDIWIERYGKVALEGGSDHFEHFSKGLDKHFLAKVYSSERGKFAVVFEDITKRKRAEHAIVQSNRLSAMGELAAGVAHDFNNALQSIISNIELALFYNGSEKAIQFLEIAKKSALDASERNNKLHRFSGNKSSKKSYKIVDLYHLVEDSIEQTRNLWKDQAQERGVTYTVTKDMQEDLTICGNEGELRSVFFNLIKNSLDAMPNGGTISIGGTIFENDIYITVADTGVGMDLEVQKKIFQPFFTTKGFQQGKGLGMTGVYTIIGEHNGSISIKETKVGVGTVFEIRLPLEKRESKVELLNVNRKNDNKINVIWVDDEEFIRQLGKRVVSRLGHAIKIAGSGKEALEMIKDERFDLLITDIGMPIMNGWKLSVKARVIQPDLKIAAFSGWGDSVDDEKMERYNVQYLVNKPALVKDIEDLLYKAVDDIYEEQS